jgi:hypothetical protein
MSGTVNSTGAVYDQKTSKFFMSQWEEYMAGHMDVREFFKYSERKIERGAWWGPGGSQRLR